MLIPIGTKVQVKNSLVRGEVTQLQLNDAKTELTFLVAFTDHEGVEHERYFNFDQLITEEA